MNPDQPAEDPESGGTHHKTETITTDHEKIVAALAPVIDKLAPLVHAWRDVESEKVKANETGNTWRAAINNVTLVLIVGCVSGLAYSALSFEQGATAEKIVIGLLAFLGGLGARR